jgi:hypothetical protein
VNLDERLSEAARQVADRVTPPAVDLESVRRQGRARQRRSKALTTVSVLAVTAVALVVKQLGPTTTVQEPVAPPRSSVPATTQRVYVVTQPWTACQFLDGLFDPFVVTGPGYRTTVTPTHDCRQQKTGNMPVTSFVLDVPMPETGTVTVTPGDQPAAELDARKVTRRHGVSVWYTRTDFGVYEFSFLTWGRELGGR